MISGGRIPMNEVEEAEMHKLRLEHPDASAVSVTRAEPGEQGNLLVQIDDEVWEIDPDGAAVKL